MHWLWVSASLLQVSDEMQFPRNEASNNAALWPIAFVSKGLTSTETSIALAQTAWPREIPSLQFHLQGQHDNRP